MRRTVNFPMTLRGKKVHAACRVYYSRQQIHFEEEIVIEHPEWELTRSELANLQQAAMLVYHEIEEEEEET